MMSEQPLNEEQDDDIEMCSRATAYASMVEVLGEEAFIKVFHGMTFEHFNLQIDLWKLQ